MRYFALIVIALLAGCGRRDETKIEPVHEIRPTVPKATEDLPIVRSKADVETFDHKRAIVYGTYDVQPISFRRKGGLMTTIILADGTLVYRSYGLVKSELALVNKRVRCVGMVTKGAPEPMMQSVSGAHVQPESIALAEGEVAAEPVPTELPTPPMITAIAGFAAHVDRWVAVGATVDSVLSVSGGWGAVILKLADGGLVSVDHVYVSDWNPFLSKPITVIGRVHLEGTDGGIGAMRVTIHGAGPPCAGVEPRCGMKPL